MTTSHVAAENIHGLIEKLETALGRVWIADDFIRTMNRVKQVFDSGNDNVILFDQINGELEHLLGENWSESGNVGVVGCTLFKYYHLLLRTMPAGMDLLQQQQEHLDHAVYQVYTLAEDFEEDDEYLDDDDDDDVTSRNRDEEEHLSEEAIFDHLKTRSVMVNCCKVVGEKLGDFCCVCQEDLYQLQEKKIVIIARLDCKHEYHVHCIGDWLRQGRNCCPLCKAVVVIAGNP